MRRLLALLALAVAACAMPGAYHARTADNSGYSEEQLGPRTWRVEYGGDQFDSAETVERNMLRRAAELTLANGYDWFTQGGQAVEGEIVIEGRAPSAAASAVWRPRWRRRSRYEWTDWDPRGAPPGHGGAIVATERYSASAEIFMGPSPAPSGAIDARAVLASPE
jgi:hypothetical protein